MRLLLQPLKRSSSLIGKSLFCVLWLLVIIVLSLSACQVSPPTPTSIPILEPVRHTPTVLATSVPQNSTEAPADIQLATETPTPQPTPAPLRLGADPAVPGELVEAAQQMAAEQPGRFTWAGTDKSDVRLVIDGGRPIATWIYALAAPFYTLTDEVSTNELFTAWRDGRLYLDQETNLLLQEFWGQPLNLAIPVDGEDLVETLWQAQEEEEGSPLTILPFHRLYPQLKVLRLDGLSPVAVDFEPAGYPLAVPIGLLGEPGRVEEIMREWSGPGTNRDDSRITHLAMTGPAGMRRAVADRMERYGLTYPAEETGPVLQAVDIAHMSNENAFATDCPMPDPYDSDNVCNRDEYVELMTWMGIDVNEMTGNHLNDWGASSLLHTFDLYEQLGIKTFGGGRDLEHARQPLLMEHNGNRIAFVGCNPVGPELAWAKADYPGSLPCEDYSFLKEQIGQLDDEGYVVVVTLQYNEDYRYDPRPEQQVLFHELAEAGATAVSGSQGHHPQGFAFDGDSFIHYGLGNLLADQMWSLPTRQTFIDTYLIYDGRLLNIDLWTGLNEDYARIRQMTAGERSELLESVFAVSER